MKPLLFSRIGTFEVLQYRQQMLKEDIDRLGQEDIRGASEEELVHGLATKYKLEIPVLEEERAYVSYREVDVDVSHDPMRLIFDRDRPFYIKGMEITFSIPFKGDPEMFQVRPSTFTLNPPRGEVHRNEVRLTYTRTDNNAAAAKTEYERSVQEIKQHLTWLEASIVDFNSKVGQQVQALVGQRKQKLSAAADMISALGLPIKNDQKPSQSVTESSRAESLRRSTKSSKKWDLFISHASEDKNELVRPLAKALKSSGASVWYDEFSLKMGDSLRASIDYGLANSRFGLVVLSKGFFAKHWPVQELNGLAAREVNGRKVILPIWHKVNFDDVRAFSPMLADKVAISSDVGMDKLVDGVLNALE